MPQRIPPELLASTPPTQAMSVLAGSGPSLRPWGQRTRLAWPRTVPGLTRALAPSSSTSTPVQCRRTSTRIPSLWDWPLRLVPPARKVTGTLDAREYARTFAMSFESRAITTALGSSRYGLASEAYRTRSITRVSTRPGPSNSISSERRGSGVPEASSSGARSVAASLLSGAIRVTSGASRSIGAPYSRGRPERPSGSGSQIPPGRSTFTELVRIPDGWSG